MLSLKIYKISNFLYKKKMKKFSKILDIVNYYLHNSIIPGSCTIGENTKIAYGGIGVVIHGRAIIGSHCLIGQGITIGGRNGIDKVPIIEDNVYLGAGVRVLGDIVIGHDSIIAPNAIIVKNVAPFSVMAGIPAKKINVITKENFEKYVRNYGPIKYMEEKI